MKKSKFKMLWLYLTGQVCKCKNPEVVKFQNFCLDCGKHVPNKRIVKL